MSAADGIPVILEVVSEPCCISLQAHGPEFMFTSPNMHMLLLLLLQYTNALPSLICITACSSWHESVIILSYVEGETNVWCQHHNVAAYLLYEVHG